MPFSTLHAHCTPISSCSTSEKRTELRARRRVFVVSVCEPLGCPLKCAAPAHTAINYAEHGL